MWAVLSVVQMGVQKAHKKADLKVRLTVSPMVPHWAVWKVLLMAPLSGEQSAPLWAAQRARRMVLQSVDRLALR